MDCQPARIPTSPPDASFRLLTENGLYRVRRARFIPEGTAREVDGYPGILFIHPETDVDELIQRRGWSFA